MFSTIKNDTTAEIVEKKSKFIANIFYVESIEEAENKIQEVKKKHYDARHNCFAYSIFTENGLVNKFSDDGEPSGTAGAPMLNILTSNNLSNVLVVVTRYFGGILLGTGGLVRAYSESMQKALENVEKVNKDLGIEAYIKCDYSDLEKIKYYFNQEKIQIVDISYDEKVSIKFELQNYMYDEIIKRKEEFNFKIIDINIIRRKYINIL